MQAAKDIRDGIIGNPYMGKAWYANNRKSIGIEKKIPVPSTLDFELWQGRHHARISRITWCTTTGIGSGIGARAKHVTTAHMRLIAAVGFRS